MSAFRRSLRSAAVMALVVLAALLLATVMGVSAQERDVNGQDPYAYLDMLDESDLKKMLFDKMHGQVQLDAFRRKADLVAAVRQLEEREDKAAHFNAQVNAAMARKAEAEKQQQQQQEAGEAAAPVSVTAAPAKHRHHGAATAVGGAEANNNKNDNMNKKVVQLIDDDDNEGAKDTVEVRARSPAREKGARAAAAVTAPAGRSARSAAKHTLEVLYCTG